MHQGGQPPARQWLAFSLGHPLCCKAACKFSPSDPFQIVKALKFVEVVPDDLSCASLAPPLGRGDARSLQPLRITAQTFEIDSHDNNIHIGPK